MQPASQVRGDPRSCPNDATSASPRHQRRLRPRRDGTAAAGAARPGASRGAAAPAPLAHDPSGGHGNAARVEALKAPRGKIREEVTACDPPKAEEHTLPGAGDLLIAAATDTRLLCTQYEHPE